MFLGVTGMLMLMSYTDEDRRRIAQKVRRARVEKNLDKEPAARAAKVNSITWKRVEDAESVRDVSLGKILRSLGLPDADAILTEDAQLSGEGQLAAAVPVPLHAATTDELLEEVRRRIDGGASDRMQDWPWLDRGRGDAGAVRPPP